MPGFVGLPEIILFGIVALLVFGPKKLPEMGRSLGHGLREFKDSVSGDGSSRTSSPDTEVLAQLRSGEDQSDPFAEVRATTPAPAPAAAGADADAPALDTADGASANGATAAR